MRSCLLHRFDDTGTLKWRAERSETSQLSARLSGFTWFAQRSCAAAAEEAGTDRCCCKVKNMSAGMKSVEHDAAQLLAH